MKKIQEKEDIFFGKDSLTYNKVILKKAKVLLIYALLLSVVIWNKQGFDVFGHVSVVSLVFWFWAKAKYLLGHMFY